MPRYVVTPDGVYWTRPETGRTYRVLCSECPQPAVGTYRCPDCTDGAEHPRCADHDHR